MNEITFYIGHYEYTLRRVKSTFRYTDKEESGRIEQPCFMGNKDFALYSVKKLNDL